MKKCMWRVLCAVLVLVMVICIAPVPKASAASPEDRLEDFNKEIYDYLKAQIKAVANGERTSTEFQISDPNGILKWTKEELGVATMVSGGSFTQEALDAASAKFEEIFDFQKTNNTLAAELPYDLYWYDKTKGISMMSSRSGNSNEIKITSMVFKFAVSQDYAAGNYVTDPAKIAAAKGVVNTAEAIVAKHADKTDLEKLAAYRDEICQLVTYNHSAADNDATLYGNPWQLINVFDGDATTNVVCEGYSKAFKYLCDLTDFEGEVECHLVDGYMQGGTGAGGHMWNVVEIGGGVLMVDVTNCDAGTVGAPDKLFLKVGQKSGDTYAFDCGSRTIYYTYSATEEDLHTDGFLELRPMTEQPPEDETCEHNYKTTVTPATFTKYGSIVEKCDKCGDVASNTTISFVNGVTLSETSYTYDGQVKTPTVTLKNSGGKTLVQGTDYTLTYDSGRTAVGTYNVVITLKGNYSGTKTLSFEIVPAAAQLAITTQPKAAKLKAGTAAKFTVKATGDGLKYQWQSSSNGTSWKNCSSTSATKATFSFTSRTSHNGNYYRCAVTDAYGNTVYTDAVRLYVLGITTQPKTLKIKAGTTAKLTVKATGDGLKYQWQSSGNGTSWKNCSSTSATKATFSFTSKTRHNGNYYRCVVTDSAGNTVYTDAVRLYVLGITTQPKTQKVKAGDAVKYTVKATGTGLKYQWQSSSDGKSWKNCSSTSATKATFTFTAKTSHSSNYYRCKITDSAGNTVYTSKVRLYVLSITEQPVSKTVTKGKTAKFEVAATGAGKVYQWQVSTDGGKTWKNCTSSSAKKATFTFTAKTSHSGNYYRCRVKDSGGNTVYSSKVKLTVK